MNKGKQKQVIVQRKGTKPQSLICNDRDKKDAWHLYSAINVFRNTITLCFPKTILRSRLLRTLEDEAHYFNRIVKGSKEDIGSESSLEQQLSIYERALDQAEKVCEEDIRQIPYTSNDMLEWQNLEEILNGL